MAEISRAAARWNLGGLRGRPDAFRPDLARSLHNLSSRLADLGQPQDALDAGQEAVTIRRELTCQVARCLSPRLEQSLRVVVAWLQHRGSNASSTHPRGSPRHVITVRYRALYPSVTLWPLTRTVRRAIIERINPASRTSAPTQHSQPLSADAYQCRTNRDPARHALGGPVRGESAGEGWFSRPVSGSATMSESPPV